MLKSLRKSIKNNKGFTLVELVIVLAILGLLLAVAIPRLGGSRETAARRAHDANVRTLRSAATMFIADDDFADGEITWTKNNEDQWEQYLEKWPDVPKGIKDISETEYTVTINAGGDVGKIEVTPDAFKDND